MARGAATRAPLVRAGPTGLLLGLILVLGSAAQGEDYQLSLPLGLQEQAAYIPEDNPLSAEKIALGKQLFWDRRWSRNGTVACVSCHDPNHGWGDPRQFSSRFDGQLTPRHSPTLINRLFSDRQQWAGTRESLEDQAFKASDQSPDLLVKNLGAIPAYQEQFRRVFGTDFNAVGVAQAIAAYERTILSGDSAYDRFSAGDTGALSPAAQRGLSLFEAKARCVRCHAGFNFTDESFHNIGVGINQENPDLGRYTVTQHETDKGAFKTPTLRDVAVRAPYMHDGSLASLEDVVTLYNQGGHQNPWLSKEIQPLRLTAEEQVDLVAFLKALTGEIAAEVSRPPTLPQ